jgi:hypothetical protein
MRRLSNLLAIASLLLFIGQATLWLRQSKMVLTRGKATADRLSYRSQLIVYDGNGLYVGDFHINFNPAVDRQLIAEFSRGLLDTEGDGEKVYPCGLSLQFPPRHSPMYRGPLYEWSLLGHFAISDSPTLTGTVRAWQYHGVQLPHWFVALGLLLGGTPFFRTVRRAAQRKSRIHNNRCITCGYDLRATPDRCPECGTPITAF